MKIITVVGARPQFIKAATVSRAIIEHNKKFPDNFIIEKIIHTGQHYDANMSDVFFDEMEIPKPEYTLGIGGGSHGAMTGQQLEKIEQVLLEEKPDYILVYGDTNSTLAGALAAAKLHVPVLHVEAGLRSFNMKMPEEINRILTDQVSSILFCPTQTAVDNLANEGFNQRDVAIHNVGDVMLDAALYYAPQAVMPKQLSHVNSPFALMTIHRAENTDDLDKLREIVQAINELSKTILVICPLHPRTRKIIESLNVEINATILDPVGYFEMIWLLQQCQIVVTDSGGLQKEAYFFNKPCVTLRDQTEWVELITVKANTLSAINQREISEAVLNALITPESVFNHSELYGQGNAAEKIVGLLISQYYIE